MSAAAPARPDPPPRSPRRLLVALTAAALLLGALEAVWRLTGDPGGPIDYGERITELAASHQPEGRDGWPLIVSAAVTAQRAEDDARQRWLDLDPHSMPYVDYLRDAAPPTGGWEAAREVLEAIEQSGAIEMLAEAAGCPRMLRPLDGSPLVYMRLPHLSPIRSLAKARAASMRLAADEGETDAVVTAFEHGLALSRATASQTFIIDRLVGMAIESLMLEELRMELLEHDFDEPTCRALLAAMDRQAWPAPVTVAVECERMIALDTIEWAFSDDGHGDGRLGGDRNADVPAMGMFPAGPFAGIASAFHVGRAETTALINAFYDDMLAAARLPAPQRLATGAIRLPLLSWRHTFVQAMLPALTQWLDQEDLAMTQRRHARIAIALEAFHARHGRWPATLDELAGELLEEVPADPLSGRSFAYRQTPPGSAVPYLLYSIGVDGVDDSATLTAPAEWGPGSGDYWLRDVRAGGE